MELTDTKIVVLGPSSHDSPIPLGGAVDGSGSVFVPDGARVRYAVEFGTQKDAPADLSFEKAGPRERIYFDPASTKAAIVTCGGLCPGLNNVVRSVVNEFHFNYGVRSVWGARYGYMGLNPKVGEPLTRLTPELVDHIHESGGTFLGSSRGPQPLDDMVDFLLQQKINILLCVGGDGTLRGANDIAKEIGKRGASISVIGIPKTIDNDVMYTTRTFGFATAAEVARYVLNCAHTEAKSAYNGIGLVKLMGRDAGFIAAAATLASQEVNFCLIPEIPIVLEGAKGFLETLGNRIQSRHHALVVIAEGAGQDLIRQSSGATDASGNKRYGDIGAFMKEEIVSYFKSVDLPVDVKYFDPSYLIRSVPANVDDAIICDQLARHAVHAAMAGKTQAVIGFLNGTFAHIPFSMAVSRKKQVDPEGIFWTGVLAATGQPKRWS